MRIPTFQQKIEKSHILKLITYKIAREYALSGIKSLFCFSSINKSV